MPKRVDANQPEIVADLRGIRATVQHLHEVGKGCPDILVGFRGNNWLFEIKTKAGKLTPDEITWHNEWKGRVITIKDSRMAIDLMGGYACPADVPPF